MQERQRLCLRGEVLVELIEVVEVAHANQRGQPALGERVVILVKIERRDHYKGGTRHQQKYWHQSAYTPRIKSAEAECAGCHRTGYQLCDDEPGDHEEYIDTDEATGDAGELVVVENDEDDRERSKPFDICAKSLHENRNQPCVGQWDGRAGQE